MSEGDKIARPVFQKKGKRKQGGVGTASTATTLPANVTEVALPEPTPPDTSPMVATPPVATPLDTTPPDPITPPNLTGDPSKVATSAISDLRYAWPKDFFDLQLRPKFVRECMVETTNKRAASEGAGPGGTKYSDYTPFDVPEM